MSDYLAAIAAQLDAEPPCCFCPFPLALGDTIACSHHRAVLASVIDPDQAQWDRDHPTSTWRPNDAEEAERMRWTDEIQRVVEHAEETDR